MIGEAAFRAALRSALERPEGERPGAVIPMPAFTVLIPWGDETDALEIGIEEWVGAFERSGRPPGRIAALVPATAAGEPDRPRAARLRERFRIPATAHDPDHSPCFAVARGPDGVALEVSDELREAEAVVLVAGSRRAAEGAGARAGAALVPGLLSSATRRALESAAVRDPTSWDRARRAVFDAVPVDFVLAWSRAAGDAWMVRCGRGTGALLDPSEHAG